MSALHADAVRAAVAVEDWDAAFARLDEYDASVRARFTAPGGPPPPEECAGLLAGHQALMQELAAMRDTVANALRQFQRERRGVQAYLGNAG
jgi:hypothetical protein